MHPALPAASHLCSLGPRVHTCTLPTQQPESCLVQCPGDTHAPRPLSSLRVFSSRPQGTHMHPAHPAASNLCSPQSRGHTCSPPCQQPQSFFLQTPGHTHAPRPSSSLTLVCSTAQGTHMHPALPAASHLCAPQPRGHTCTPPSQQPQSFLFQTPGHTHAPHPPSSLRVVWSSAQGTHMHPAHPPSSLTDVCFRPQSFLLGGQPSVVHSVDQPITGRSTSIFDRILPTCLKCLMASQDNTFFPPSASFSEPGTPDHT